LLVACGFQSLEAKIGRKMSDKRKQPDVGSA